MRRRRRKVEIDAMQKPVKHVKEKVKREREVRNGGNAGIRVTMQEKREERRRNLEIGGIEFVVGVVFVVLCRRRSEEGFEIRHFPKTGISAFYSVSPLLTTCPPRIAHSDLHESLSCPYTNLSFVLRD